MPNRRLPYLFAAVILLAGCTSIGKVSSSPTTTPSTLVETSTGPDDSPSPVPSRPAGTSPSPTTTASCAILPSNNVWHADVSHLPVLAASATYVASIGTGAGVHADFGSGLYQGAPIGIPITTVPATQPKVTVTFQYRDESDTGPYPVPRTAKIEGGTCSKGDRHVILYDPAHCLDYELYAAYPQRRRLLESRLRRDLRPAQQQAAPSRLDLGGRGRPADPAWAGDLGRGGVGAHRPRDPGDRAGDPGRVPVAGPAPGVVVARHRRCRRWACGCG